MATQAKILAVLSSEAGPVGVVRLGELLGEPRGNWQTQLDRMVKKDPPWLGKTEDGEYIITEAGRQELELERQTVPPQFSQDQLSHEELGVTPYQEFKNLGRSIGVTGSDAFLNAITDYVWTGNWRDPAWVWKALQGMAIRDDLIERWVNAWSAKQGASPPLELAKKMRLSGLDEKEREKIEAAEVKEYILNENDDLVKVGVEVGILTYNDALALSKVRALSKNTRGPSGQSDPIDYVTKIIQAVDSMRGAQPPASSYMVKMNPDGTTSVEALDPAKPNIIQAQPPKPPEEAKKRTILMINPDGTVTTHVSEGDTPIVLGRPPSPPAAAPPATRMIVIDKNTGEREEVPPGSPLVIFRDKPNSNQPMIQMKDKEGNPVTFDIDTYLRLEDHKQEMAQRAESHEQRVEIMKSIKEFVAKGAKVAERMSRDGGKTK